MWLFLSLIFFHYLGSQWAVSTLCYAYILFSFVVYNFFITSSFSAGLVFHVSPLRLGVWKWFWICLCEVPRGLIDFGLIFMLNFYGRLCFQRMLKQYLFSCKLFCNVSLSLFHQEMKFIPHPNSGHPFYWALTNRNAAEVTSNNF